MSIFDRFRTPPPPPLPCRDVAALATPLAAPALRLVLGTDPARSHFGGDPMLPAGVTWPVHEGRKLVFLARLSLPELHATLPVPWLPVNGALLLFYDLESESWGFDPDDRGSWAVLHVEDLTEPVDGPAAPPDMRERAVPFLTVRFLAMNSLPSDQRDEVRVLALNDAESEEWYRLMDMPFAGRPHHQVAGFPSPIQGDDMALEAQLASHGIYCGDASGYQDPRAKALEEGARDWRLLLQFDTDDDLDLMWGDAGMLYFWVREDAARCGDFSDAWAILQCH